MTPPLSNRPHLEDLRAMALGAIAALPADILALLQGEAETALDAAKALKDWLDGAIALRYGDRAAAQRRAQGKDTGTVRFEDDGVTIVTDLPKKVEWDQERLAAVVARIREAGDDPADYVETTLRVSERAYGAWPPSIRAAFEPARTVKTGKPSFRLTLAEGER